MGKASRTKVDSSRREKIAAQRAAERRAEQRQRILIASGSILAVMAIVLAFIVVKAGSKPALDHLVERPDRRGPGQRGVQRHERARQHPGQGRDGGGAVTGQAQAISGGAALTANGKPEMLYMGAEYCPYCAAERWAMIVALSRFGTFSGLATMHSAVGERGRPGRALPEHADLDVRHGQVHQQVPDVHPGRDADQHPGQVDRHLHQPADADQGPAGADEQVRRPAVRPSGSNGAIPFIDFGNKYVITGASYNPEVLSGLSWAHDRGRPEQPEQRRSPRPSTARPTTSRPRSAR